MPVQIFTSYHAKASKLKEMGFAVISISVGFPTFGNIDDYAGKIPSLAPTRAMLKMSHEQYYKAFDAILERTSAYAIYQEIAKIAIDKGLDKAVLLCFEKDRETCHRSYVGNWLAQCLSIPVEEVVFDSPGKIEKVPVAKKTPPANQLFLF